MKAIYYSFILIAGGMILSSGLSAAELGGSYTTDICPTSLNIPERPAVDAVLEPDDTHMTADEADLVENGISTLTGNAEITRNQQQVRADRIIYDQPGDTADLDGHVNYWDEGLFLQSHDAHLQFDNGVGEFSNADYTLIDSRGRGTADKMVLDIGTRTDMEQVEYTTCDPDDEFWKLTASKISLDHENNRGTGRNVVVRIKNVPVFYTPYLSFPLSKERKTGFLTPGYGNTTNRGLEITTPYYWNISPNMDATLTPRFFSDIGLMAIGEYRYLYEKGSGQIGFEFLPSDNKFNDKNRDLLSLNLTQSLSTNASLYVDFNRASDKYYFEDFGNQLSTTSTSYLNQYAHLSYAKSNWSVLAAVQKYQITNPNIPDSSKPYSRLPQVYINYNKPEENRSINYGLSSQVAYFYRDTGVPGDFNAFRADIKPYVNYPISNIYSFIKPQLSFRYTQYELDKNPTFDSSLSRILPIFSLDSGLFFERDVSIFKNNYLQTLEPRLYYLFIPKSDNQSNLPVFDTGLYTFSFDTLFYEDRFSSVDRVGDANQITAAVTSQFIDKESGRNLGSLRLGQIFYFRDREVTLPGLKVRDQGTSSLVAAFNTSIISNTTISGDFQWNPYVSNGTEKITLQARYNPAPGKILNLSYRVVRSNEINTVVGTNSLGVTTTDIDQTDLSFRWPISRNWSAVGRWNYAVPEGRSLELFGGVEYESCCWGVRAVARRYLSSVDGAFDTGVFLQLELKGLAGIGKKTVDFLKQQIPGYQSEF